MQSKIPTTLLYKRIRFIVLCWLRHLNMELPADLEVEVKTYSRNRWGCYKIQQRKMILYVCRTKNVGSVRPIKDILRSATHEAVHAEQIFLKSYTRSGKKVMWHGSSFQKRYKELTEELQ